VKNFLLIALSLLGFISPCQLQAKDPASAPNILWIVMDDVGVQLPCYGENAIQTPHIDRLVREGTRFENAFLTCSVCSPSRSAMITGMYQTTIGAHHHRSGRGTQKIHLPPGIEPVPALFQRAGYHTSNVGDTNRDTSKGQGKTDYNFEWNKKNTMEMTGPRDRKDNHFLRKSSSGAEKTATIQGNGIVRWHRKHWASSPIRKR
jgi:arylsulfatase A-like enzyme